MMDRLLNEINNSNIPEDGLKFLIDTSKLFETLEDEPSQPTESENSERLDETQVLKDQIELLRQQLDTSALTIASLKSEIENLKTEANAADLDYGFLKFEKEQLEAKVSKLENQIPEEGTYSIPQLIEASNVFTPDEGDVILRFLQTFIANKEGNTMEQIKAAQANLEARKSSIPSTGEGFKSTIKINEKKFAKIDLIRIINAMYDIGFFSSTEGKKRIKGQCMITIGNALNVDLGDYSNDLSSSMQDGSKIDKHLEIFKLMAEAMEDYFNNR